MKPDQEAALEERNEARIAAFHEFLREASLELGDREVPLLGKQPHCWIGIPGVEGRRYPRWQFSSFQTLEVRPEMPDLLEAAHEAGLDSIALTALMSNPDAGNGRTPLELLDLGETELVVGIIRAQDL